MISSKPPKWLIVSVSLALAGCAQTNVREPNEIASSSLSRPQQVLVYDFAVSPEDIQQNSSIFAKMKRNMASSSSQTAEQIQLGREVADALTDELMRKIAAMGLNPVRAANGQSAPPGSILVTGHFFRIDEGNRLRRNVIGLGLGQSSIDAEVQLLAPAPSGYTELMAFKTHADSGKMPGAAILGPAGAAAGAGAGAVAGTSVAIAGAKSYRSASAQQAKKIADKISEKLGDYFVRQGWINPDSAR